MLNNYDVEGVILVTYKWPEMFRKDIESVVFYWLVIPVEILGFTTYDLWTFLARREANFLVQLTL